MLVLLPSPSPPHPSSCGCCARRAEWLIGFSYKPIVCWVPGLDTEQGVTQFRVGHQVSDRDLITLQTLGWRVESLREQHMPALGVYSHKA